MLARLVCEEMVAVMEPQEIEDGEYEQILERVAAVDVAKASGMVCTRVPREDQPGKRRTRVWQVDAATSAILELADHLVGEGIEKVTLESTSDYWRIWFYLLESAGLSVQLVRAQDVKQAPGRPKSDKLDAVWLAKLTERGMLRPSFVPPAQIRALRDYTPAAHRPDPRAHPVLLPAGKAAGRRADQGVERGQQAGHAVGPGHDRGPDRRGT